MAAKRRAAEAATPKAARDNKDRTGTFRLPTHEWEMFATNAGRLDSRMSKELLNFVRWVNHDPRGRPPRRPPGPGVTGVDAPAPGGQPTVATSSPEAPSDDKDKLGTFRLPAREWEQFEVSASRLESDMSKELLNFVRWVNHDPRGRKPRRPSLRATTKSVVAVRREIGPR
jgi:hypothetical protein